MPAHIHDDRSVIATFCHFQGLGRVQKAMACIYKPAHMVRMAMGNQYHPAFAGKSLTYSFLSTTVIRFLSLFICMV